MGIAGWYGLPMWGAGLWARKLGLWSAPLVCCACHIDLWGHLGCVQGENVSVWNHFLEKKHGLQCKQLLRTVTSLETDSMPCTSSTKKILVIYLLLHGWILHSCLGQHQRGQRGMGCHRPPDAHHLGGNRAWQFRSWMTKNRPVAPGGVGGIAAEKDEGGRMLPSKSWWVDGHE